MKKILLSMLAACAVVGASAAATDLTPVWSKTVDAMDPGQVVWNAPVSVDKDGSVIASGVFNKEITFGSATLSPVGNSSYVAKYDASGNVKWAVGIIGAASVSAIDTDDAGNVFVAGTYADEITFGTTSGDEIVKEGQMVDGAPTSKLNSSFIAKYDANGVVKAVQTFVPKYRDGLIETGGYWAEDGDCYFHINHLVADKSGVYASAIYTGETSVLGTDFLGLYNCVWGFMYVDLKSTAIFKLDSDLASLEKVVSCSPGEDEATEDTQYDASSVAFTVSDGTVYAVFAGNGPLKVVGGNTSTIDAEPTVYNYIFASAGNGQTVVESTQQCPDSGFGNLFVPFSVFVKDNVMVVVGYEAFAENYGEANERLGHDVFTFTVKNVSNTNGWEISKATAEVVEGNVAYYGISGATQTSDGVLLVSLLGYYTDKVEGDNAHSKGDFAGKSKGYMLMGKTAFAVPGSDNSYGVASDGSYAVLSQVMGGTLAYTLFNDPTGVSDVVVDGFNASVEYFNLQGMRVDTPANGVFIRRQAGKSAKVLVK